MGEGKWGHRGDKWWWKKKISYKTEYFDFCIKICTYIVKNGEKAYTKMLIVLALSSRTMANFCFTLYIFLCFQTFSLIINFMMRV